MNLPSFFSSKKLSEGEKLVFIESLSTMLRAGIPILEALESISEDSTSKKSREIFSHVASQISSGKTLSEALEKYPDSFDPVFTSIVRSGEAVGNLDKVLSQAAENLKENIETSSNIKSAMFYPALIVLVLIAVSFYSFAFALPKVAEIFFQLKLKLPAYSAFILKSSLFFSKYRYLLIALFSLLMLILYKVLTTKRARKILLSLFTSIPTVAQIVKLLDLARFTNTCAMLLKAGVPIIQVLDIAKDVVVAKPLTQAIESVKTEITQGDSLEAAMKKHPKVFPSLLRRIVKVGEESGTLDQSLQDLSENYSRKFTEIIKNITTVIEPVLIVLIACVVAILMLSIIAPLYQGIGALNQR